ncbi:MAG: hypothetical protein V8T10_05260 [Merdibacter sp.]
MTTVIWINFQNGYGIGWMKIDSDDNVVDWLAKHDTADDDPSTACAKLLENILLDIINGSSMPQIAKESEIDLALIDENTAKNKVATQTG